MSMQEFFAAKNLEKKMKEKEKAENTPVKEEKKENKEEKSKTPTPSPKEQKVIFENPNSQNASIPSASFLHNFDFYSWELIKGFADERMCQILLQGNFYPAKVVLSEFRLMVCPKAPKEFEKIYDKEYFLIPIFSIKSIEKIVVKDAPNYTIEMKIADLRTITLSVMNEIDLYEKIVAANKPTDESAFTSFAKKYRDERNEMLKKNKNENKGELIEGWTVYMPLVEFERQGVETNPYIQLSDLNVGFHAVPTYPEMMYLPSNEYITDDDIKNAMTYRTKNRIPLLSYYYKESKGSIWRSSQNKPGLKNNINESDIKLLNFLGKLSEKENDEKIIIYDARPYVAALGNMIKGGGFENVKNYENAKLIFCEIGNIHDVRNSFNKVVSLVTDKGFTQNKTFLSSYEATGWPTMLYQIINSSIDIAENTKAGYANLLHCSDGWDRTSQLSALSQIFLDHYYRTLDGFAVLIEKDFLSFGHQFKYRNGLFIRSPNVEGNDGDVSPIFFQFIDCLYQLANQFPFLFEFSTDMLIFLTDNLTSCKYGTFLYNHEKERKEKNAKNDTVSIWDDILNYKEKYTNIFYREDLSKKFSIKSFPMHKITLWEEYYLRYVNTPNDYFSPVNTIMQMAKENMKEQ